MGIGPVSYNNNHAFEKTNLNASDRLVDWLTTCMQLELQIVHTPIAPSCLIWTLNPNPLLFELLTLFYQRIVTLASLC